MDSERRQQVNHLFHSALACPIPERTAFLAQACAGDDSLLKEVESLIEAHQKLDSFTDKPEGDIAAGMRAERDTHLTAGETVGRYRIVSLLGEGGMGEVYLAQDLRLGRKTALKLLPAYFTHDAGRLRRFVQEARSASSLNHPNILTIYEIGQVDGLHFIATEFIDGVTLRQHMTGTPMKLGEVLDITAQVAAALAAAHGAGIVHRDIKPENIMVRRDGYVKVLDFGLAKLTERYASTADSEAATQVPVKTDPGIVMGTVRYMSPEQARGLVVDGRTDIWSLGIVFYEMITGRVPFEGATPSDVIVSVLTAEPLPLTQYKNDVPVELEQVVSKALRKASKDRYQTAGELLADLRLLNKELELESRIGRDARSDPREQATATKPSIGAVDSDKELWSRTDVPMARRLTERISYVYRNFDQRQRALVAFAAIILATVAIAFGLYQSNARNSIALKQKEIEGDMVAIPGGSGISASKKLYWYMTQDEQTQFIEERSELVSAMLGPNPPRLNKESVAQIKDQVENYVARRDSLSAEVFKEGLRPVYSRASIYAGFIAEAFNERHVPPVIGLYIAMIESEYHPCGENQFGGEGLFGFSPKTATRYGVAPHERCDPLKTSRAAAQYLDELTSEFGSDSASITLAIISYVMGETRVREYLHTLLNNGIRERSYWALASHAEIFDDNLRLEGDKKVRRNRYVPRFFAAAIVGENPQAFDLQIQPLSTYTRLPQQP